MKEKEDFLLYHSQFDLIEELPREDVGDLLISIFKYSMHEELPDYKKGSPLSIAFKSIKNTIDINNKKYIEKCKKNKENQNIRWEKEKYADKYVFINNEKISYHQFNKLFKKGYSSKNGLTYSFPELFEEQFSLYNLDTIVFRDNYNCSIISSKEIENYFDSITDSN